MKPTMGQRREPRSLLLCRYLLVLTLSKDTVLKSRIFFNPNFRSSESGGYHPVPEGWRDGGMGWRSEGNGWMCCCVGVIGLDGWMDGRVGCNGLQWVG